MNTKLVSELLAAYAICPLDKLRLHRQVMIDAMEEAGDWRVDKLRRWSVAEGEFARSTVKFTRWVAQTSSGAMLGGFDSPEEAEAAIRDYSRGIFLEMWPDS